MLGIGIVGLVAFGDCIGGIGNDVEDVGSDAEAANAVVPRLCDEVRIQGTDGPGRLQNAVHVQLGVESGCCRGVPVVGDGKVDVERIGGIQGAIISMGSQLRGDHQRRVPAGRLVRCQVG